MSRSIPKGQFDVFSIYFNVCDVIFKDGGDVDLSKRGQFPKNQPNRSNTRVKGSKSGRQNELCGRGDGTSGKVPLEKTLRKVSRW